MASLPHYSVCVIGYYITLREDLVSRKALYCSPCFFPPKYILLPLYTEGDRNNFHTKLGFEDKAK